MRIPSATLSRGIDASTQVEKGASLVVRDLTVKNDGWVPTPLTEAELGGEEGQFPEAIRIRGFRLDKKASHVITVTQGERCVLRSSIYDELE